METRHTHHIPDNPDELDGDAAPVDLDALDDDIERLRHLDPADAAEPAARVAEALSRALDEEHH